MSLKCIFCGEKFFSDTPLDVIDEHNKQCPYKYGSRILPPDTVTEGWSR